MTPLREKYAFGRIMRDSFDYTGIHISQNDKKEIFLDQQSFPNNLQNYEYKSQHYENILNRDENKNIRRTTGQPDQTSVLILSI